MSNNEADRLAELAQDIAGYSAKGKVLEPWMAGQLLELAALAKQQAPEATAEPAAVPVGDLSELIAGAQSHIGHGADLVRRLYNEPRPTDTVLGDWMQYAMTYMQIAYQCGSPDARPPISNAKWFEAWRAAHPVAQAIPPAQAEPIRSVP